MRRAAPDRRRRGVAALAALAGAVLVLTGCSAASPGDTLTTALAPADRGAPVQVAGTTLDGTRFDLADLHGSVVVVNFWGSWCVTCRDEAGALEKSATSMAADGVRFVGIATRDTEANAKAYLRTFPMSYPSLLDDPSTNAYLLAFRGTLPVASTPTTYVLDREGRVAARAIGLVDEARLAEMVDPVLAEG